MTTDTRRRSRRPLIAGALAVIAAGIAFAGFRTAPSPAGTHAASHSAAERAPADSGPGSGPASAGPRLTRSPTAVITTSPSPVGAAAPATSAATQDANASSACVTARLVDLPASIPMGATAVSFEGVITSHCGTDLQAVAPVFQIVGGPADHVDATLQQLDAATGTWQDTAMPEGDGGDPLTFAAHGSRLAPGQSLVLHFRLTVSTRNPAEPTASILYAVALPGDTQLALATARGQITSG
jgi:hypothetical protein